MSPVVVQPLHVLNLHHQLVMFRTWLGGAPGAFTKTSLVPSSKDDTESWTYLKAKAQSLSESLTGFFLQKFRCAMPLCAEPVQSRSLRSFGCFCSLSKTQTPTMISCAASAQSTAYDPHTKFCSYWSHSRQTWALNRLASVHQIRLDRYYRSDRF